MRGSILALVALVLFLATGTLPFLALPLKDDLE